MAAKKTSEEAGFIRKDSFWICKLPLEDGSICEQSFSRTRHKELFQQHRLKVHLEEEPLPVLKPGPVASVSKAEQNAKYAARQLRYAARKGSEVMKEQRESSKHNKLVKHYRSVFEKMFPPESNLLRPELKLPGIMTFLTKGLSDETVQVNDLWDLALHKLFLVSCMVLCTKANHPDNITQSTLQSYVEHAGLSFGAESLSWYEASVWRPMMRRIEAVLDDYTSEVMAADRLVRLREADLAMDAAHQAFVRARYAWKVSTL